MIDRDDVRTIGVGDGGLATARKDAVDIHRAGAARRDAAAEARAGQVQIVPQRPQKRRVLVHVERMRDAIYGQCVGHVSSPARALRRRRSPA